MSYHGRHRPDRTAALGDPIDALLLDDTLDDTLDGQDPERQREPTDVTQATQPQQ